MPAILLTGRPGCGKTTLIRKVLSALAVPAAGFYTEEVRHQGRRQGFDLITLDGRRVTLASVHSRSPQRVSKYGVELAALEVGVAAIVKGIGAARLIVVDEVGKMELFSPRFRQAVLAALDRGKPLLGSVMLAPHPFADELKRRPDVEVMELTEGNRPQIEARVVARLRALLGLPPAGQS